MRKSVLISGLLPCLVALGCGDDDGRIQVHPANGKVLVNGRPAHGARVVFYPEAAAVPGQTMPTPAGTTDVSGEYHLESYDPQDGAPAGKYAVTVVWPQEPPPDAQGIFDVKDRLGGRFADPKKSNLTADVQEGGGEIPPFELK